MQSVTVMLACSALAHGIQSPMQEERYASVQRRAVTTLLLAFASSMSPVGLSRHSDLITHRKPGVHILGRAQEKMRTKAVHRRTFPTASDGGLSESDLDRLEAARVGKRKPRILPWIRAKEWARSTHMQTEEDWREWIDNGEKKIPLIPSKPDEAYADLGWEGWQDFLNDAAVKASTEKAPLVSEDLESVKKRKPRLLPWISARMWARSMHMETEEDWKEWIDNGEKKTPLIPSKPDEVYADSGWEGWQDFLNEPVGR